MTLQALAGGVGVTVGAMVGLVVNVGLAVAVGTGELVTLGAGVWAARGKQLHNNRQKIALRLK
jgi:hypothetical protein